MTRSQVTPISSPYFRREAVEDVGGPVTTIKFEKKKMLMLEEEQKEEYGDEHKEKQKNTHTVTIDTSERKSTSTPASTPTSTSRALVIAGLGMRRKHSYDTGVSLLEDIEEVDSVLEKDSVLSQAFLDDDLNEDEGEEETLVEINGELFKEKEVEIEVDDDEGSDWEGWGSEGDADAGGAGATGLKRKRTVRVVIRSRAFI